MIEEETKIQADRADGYGQLIDEERIPSDGHEEETKALIAEDLPDGAESSRMGESARVKNSE